MCREELIRVFELVDAVKNPASPKAYFKNFEKSLADPFYDKKKQFFQDIEKDLRGLSQCAWSHLKEELLKTLEIRQEHRGWQPLFDKMNQAKAYNHLSSIGCEKIEFIPVYRQTGKKSRKTPDLQAHIGDQVLLCEVKTINISDDEARHRTEHSVRTIKAYLENGFFEKLKSTLMVAKDQMVAYRSEKNIRRLVYVVLNFDDRLHEYEKNYEKQLNEFIATQPVTEIEVVCFWHPAFLISANPVYVVRISPVNNNRGFMVQKQDIRAKLRHLIFKGFLVAQFRCGTFRRLRPGYCW